MQSQGFGGVAWWRSVGVVLGLVGAASLVGCGGGDDEAAASGDPAAEVAAAQTLTEEEAAVLAEFRASRDRADAVSPPPEANPREAQPSAAQPAAAPEASDFAPAPAEPADAVPYDFERASSGAVKPKPPQPQQASPKPADASPQATASPTVFIKHQVTDPGMNGMVANTVLVPEGWTVEGGMTRGSNMLWYNPFFHDVMYKAPDGRQLHFFPSLSFEFNTQAMQQGAKPFQPINGNLYYPLPETPGQWIMELIRNNPDPDVTNVKLVSEEPEPDLTKQLQQRSAMMYQTAQQVSQTGAQLGMGSAFDTQATVIKIRYTENGIDLEESILMAWQYFINHSQGQLTGGTWSVPLMVSLRGPVGTDYVNDPELMTVLQSLRINPQWQNEMNRYWQELARIQRRGQEQRNRDWQAHNAKMQEINNETNAIIAGGYAKRTAIQDAGYAKQIDSIREVSPYNIGGQTVKIPDYYDNVHTDGTGRYILSNDLNYNPNRDLNLPGNWTKVEPQR